MFTRPLRITSAVAAIAAAAALVACGGDSSGDSDSDQIEAVTAEFATSIETKDPAAFCDALAPSEVEALGGEKGCLKTYSVADNSLFKLNEYNGGGDPDIEIESLEIEGDAATATLTNEGILGYAKEDGTWFVVLGTP